MLTRRRMVADVLGHLVDVFVLFDVVSGPRQPRDAQLVSQRADPEAQGLTSERLAIDINVVSPATISHRFAIGSVDSDVVVRHDARSFWQVSCGDAQARQQRGLDKDMSQPHTV